MANLMVEKCIQINDGIMSPPKRIYRTTHDTTTINFTNVSKFYSFHKNFNVFFFLSKEQEKNIRFFMILIFFQQQIYELKVSNWVTFRLSVQNKNDEKMKQRI